MEKEINPEQSAERTCSDETAGLIYAPERPATRVPRGRRRLAPVLACRKAAAKSGPAKQSVLLTEEIQVRRDAISLLQDEIEQIIRESVTSQTPPPPTQPTPPCEKSASQVEENFNSRAEEARSAESSHIQDLISVARGTALILNSMWESMEERREASTISGLASALFDVVEPADAYFFASAGELNERISAKHRIYLLEKELEKARQTLAAKNRANSHGESVPQED